MTGATAAILLERERELGELEARLAAASQGGGRVVLVEAAAGLGKTSLLRAAGERAAELGCTCLRARAGELERDFAFGCVRQLLEPAVAKAADRERLFAGAAALSRPLLDPAGAPSSPAAPDASFAILHGLYWLLSNLADERPVVVAVDDLQWADAESLRFLAYLAPRLDGVPVLVIGSRRAQEGPTGELARLATAPETAVLRLEPLSIEATTTLCERGLGEPVAPDFAAACRAATGGNPFFLGALLREAAEQRVATDARGASALYSIGPAAVAQAVLLRLSGAPVPAARLVRAVAILGDGASLAEAAALARLPQADAASAADLAIARGILAADGLAFAHPIVREAVYADIGAHERSLGHARAAEILAAAGAPEERIAAQVANAEPAGDPERVELLRRVAAGALARGAPAAAVASLTRALAEPPPEEARPGLLLELGSAQLRVGEPGAVAQLAAAVALIREPRLLASSVRRLALALTISERAGEAVAAIAAAIDAVEPADRELALLLEAELHAHAQQAGLEARGPAASRLERRGELAGATPGERLVLASRAFERARASESAAEAAALIEHALAGGRLLAEQELDVAGPFYHLLIGLLATDALDLAQACLQQALAAAQARASIPALAYVTGYRAQLWLRRGAVEEAEADARTATELLTAHGIRFGRETLPGLLAEALIERGELDAAERELRPVALDVAIAPGLTGNVLLEARAQLHLARGRTRAGLEDLVELGRRDELWGGASPLASRWRSRAALAAAASGEGERARAMATEDVRRARRWGAASGIGIALRAAALVAGGPASIDRLRESVDVLARSPARLEHARSLIDLGAALRRANRRSEARGPLRQGIEGAVRCGAGALVARGRRELRAAGGRSSDPTASGAAQLTASERRVAELAAAGRSNPEIAQELFVTRKTVETHLGRVYRKLEIPGRQALAGALALP